jgi:hypothetical protein
MVGRAWTWFAAHSFSASSRPSHFDQRSTIQRGWAYFAATCPIGSASREGSGAGLRFSETRRNTAFA